MTNATNSIGNDLNTQLEKLANAMIKDYGDNEFDKFTVSFEKGSKYIRIVKTSYGSNSCAGFVVVSHDSKFPYGSLLKAATWKAPAMNFARGSIFNDEHIKKVRWTGIN